MNAAQSYRLDGMIDAVIEILASHGVRACWEYPGYFALWIDGTDLRISYGPDGREWYGNVERVTALGERPYTGPVEPALVIGDDASTIAAALLDCYARLGRVPFPLAGALLDPAGAGT